MTRVQVQLPPKLVPVFLGDADYRGAYGGRGSAKTRSFAKMTAVRGLQLAQAGDSGVLVCGREFQNSLDDSSMAEVKAAIESEPWLLDNYEIGEKYIRTKDHRIDYAFIGLRHNLASIKSKARIKLFWVDEADPLSEGAWQTALPSVREDGSEVWVTWNPERNNSATDRRFRKSPPSNAKIVELNWRDNPWFPDALDRKRLDDLRQRPDQYDHVWEGGYKRVTEGAYFAQQITLARSEGRVGKVAYDPLFTVRLFADIGGTGARADSFVFWAVQFVGREIRVLNHYEAVGQELGEHLRWMRKNGYTPGTAQIWLPHDGGHHDKVFRVSYESAFADAGYDVTVIPNQGAGAASLRVEAVRRRMPACWFNEATTAAGLEALGSYAEKRDEKRNVGLGPDHNWASHSADAFGLVCVVYEEPIVRRAAWEDEADDRVVRSKRTSY